MSSAPSDHDIHQRFAPFGDIKLVFADPRRDDVKYIEFFDSRGAVKAYDHLNGRPCGPAGGTFDLAFEWDKPAPVPPPAPAAPPHAQHGGYGFQQQQAPGGAYGAPAPRAGASPYPGGPGGASPYPGAPPPQAAMSPYGAAAPPPPPPPAPAPHGVDHAKKMQDLLASLVANNQGALGPPGAQQQQQQQQPQYGQEQYGAPPPQQQQHSNGYPSYAHGPTPAPAQPAAPYSGRSPLPPAIGSPLGAAASSSSSSAPAPSSSLPAAVTSLLAQAGGAPAPAQDGGATPQQQQQQNGGYSPAPAPGSGSAPASPEKQGQAQAQAPAQVQALLALLVRHALSCSLASSRARV